ncbi:hypothetical protein VKT23_001935 [Stygiomarasmius scandens]|uniref:Uncharacterized protein n=1 Tax=Marasmiellus scandens TaxID=2682957 RepID=A0ABR1K365_9AGAR
MDLPSTRELELESLLREKEEQITELGDEVTRLRQYLSTQPGPSTADPVTLPPPLVSLLLPHLHTQTHVQSAQTSQTEQHQPSSQLASSQADSSLSTLPGDGVGASSSSSSTAATSTMHTALTQRVKLLQEENDELYEILKQSETGRLKEEVQSLKRLVEKLEGALRESHSVILSLSTELDKSYESFNSSKYNNSKGSYSDSRAGSQSNHYANSGPSNGSGSGGKPPPTGPRAHKKPRLSEANSQSHSRSSPSISPHLRNNTMLPSQNQSYQNNNVGQHHGHGQHHRRSHSNSSRHREHSEHPSPRGSGKGPGNVKPERMDVDEDNQQNKSRVRSPEQRRDRGDRERDGHGRRDRDRDGVGHRDRGREREREKHRGERDKDKETSRRNGNGNGVGRMGGRRGGGGGGGDKLEDDGGFGGGDRTLAERMGL